MSTTATSLPSTLPATPDFAHVADAATVRKRVADAVRVGREAGTMRVEERRASESGYSARMDVVAIRLGGDPETTTRGGGDGESGLRVVLVFGEHGREFVPVDVGVRLIETFAKGEDAVVALGRGSAAGSEAFRETLRSTTFVIIPMENENGRDLVEKGDLCERKNGHGVDPNRNWALDWGVKAPDYDPKEEYPGKAPFSEPESRILRDLVADFKPHAVVNWHSGMSAVFTPYDHVAREPTGPGAEAMLQFARVIDAEHCDKKCVLGSGGKGVGYLAHGTAADYIYDTMHVPVVYTWEIYGDLKAKYEDCYRMFNPVTRESYEAVVQAWIGAPITLVSMLDKHPDINVQRGGRQGMRPRSVTTVEETTSVPFSGALAFALFVFACLFGLRRRRSRLIGRK